MFHFQRPFTNNKKNAKIGKVTKKEPWSGYLSGQDSFYYVSLYSARSNLPTRFFSPSDCAESSGLSQKFLSGLQLLCTTIWKSARFPPSALINKKTEEALSAHERVSKIVEYIIDHFDQKTKRNSFYDLKGQRVNGFNSIFAVSSIPMAKKYYLEFKKQLEEKHKDLTIATIYSYAPNEEDNSNGILEDEEFATDLLDQSSREFLDFVIVEYNKKFVLNFLLYSTITKSKNSLEL